MVIQAALALLNTAPSGEFTMTQVAQTVGTTTMALYRYFPSREALLEAVSRHVFGQFTMPDASPAESWQDTLFAWQCAFKAHFERYPALTRLMAWNGRVSGAWMRVQMPVIEALHAAGFRGHLLAHAVNWFLTDTSGMLTIELADLLLSFDGRGSAAARRTVLSVEDSLDLLDDRQKALILDLARYARELDPEVVLMTGFRHLIAGIELLLREQASTAQLAAGAGTAD
jgi:AcrR family transcriptional regulator